MCPGDKQEWRGVKVPEWDLVASFSHFSDHNQGEALLGNVSCFHIQLFLRFQMQVYLSLGTKILKPNQQNRQIKN